MKNIYSNNKESIISNEKALLAAMIRGDILKLNKLIYKNMLSILPNGQTINKEMGLEIFRSRNIKIREIKPITQRINLIGDNAIVTTSIEIKGHYFDYILDGKYRFIRVWKLFNNTWKVIAESGFQIKK